MVDLPPPVPSIEFNLSSTGFSKGLAQTEGPQFLARGEIAFGQVYFGAYAKNVTSSSADGEAAAIIGLRRSRSGFDGGVSAAWKRAIDSTPGSDANALEINVFASRRIGQINLRVSVTWSPDDLASTGGTTYAELATSYRIDKTLSASATVGRRERGGGLDYTAWNAGLAWTPVKPVTLDLRYYDTNRGNDNPYKARLVGAARLKF